MKYNNFMPKGIKGFQKGHLVPKEIRNKISQTKQGSQLSNKTKEKMRLAHLGKKYKPMSEQGKKNLSKAHKGIKQSKELVQKRIEGRQGYRHTQETINKITEAHKKRFINHVYKTDESKRIRKSQQYEKWREAVFIRDNYTCQRCDQRGNKLHPHHIRNFKKHIKLRFIVHNGITFCEKCHKLFHKKYGVINNNYKQIQSFIDEITC